MVATDSNACEMKKLFALLVMLFSAASAFAQTPTATPTAAYDFPSSPTLGQKVTGPGAQTFQWDGTKWIALGGPGSTFAPLVNISGGVNNYAPINAPSFTGLTIASQMQVANTLSAPTANFGNTTISSGSVLMMAGSAALYFNGIPPGGTCAAGNAVTSISATIVPTCSPIVTGGPFLPLTGGTLNGPGNLTVNGTLTQNGNAQFGGGATIAFGLQVPNYINVNGPATFNGTTTLNGNVTFPSGSTATTAGFNNVVALGIGQAAGVYGYSLEITRNQNADTGINVLNNNGGPSAVTSIYVWNGGPSLKLQQFGTGASFGGVVGPSIVSSDGPELDFDRTGTSPGGLKINNNTGPVSIYVNNTHTEDFIGWTLNFPATNVGSQIQFGTYNAPDASILGWGPMNLHIDSGAWWNGGQWTTSASNAPIDINMLTNGNLYPNMTIGMAGYTGGGTAISSWPVMATFENHPYVQGLNLPGYANRYGNGQPVAGLTVGNGYISGINWANISISGASYPIANGNGWQTDCGAGSGMTLFQVGPGGGLHMYNHTGLGCNAGFAWNNIANWSVAGMSVNHIENLDEEPAATLNGASTESPVPSVTSGALVRGSRDMFGWIKDVRGGQTTLTFTQEFDGESTCTLTDAGQPNLWFEANQTTGQDTFVCVVPWTGEPCPDGAIVEYHCFGQGG